MMSKIPVEPGNNGNADVDKEILRAAIIAELDAVNLYEQMAGIARKSELRAILLDIAREEKTHIGEFQALLLKEDAEHAAELAAGEREVEEKAGDRERAA